MQSNIPLNKEEPIGVTPEINKSKPKKKFKVEIKWNGEPNIFRNTDWRTWGRYEKLKDAEQALKHLEKDRWYKYYLCRVVEI